MPARVNDPTEVKRVLKELWDKKKYMVFYLSLLHLYPVLTKDLLSKIGLDISDLGAFFITSFVIVIGFGALGIVSKHILVFIPAMGCFLFLFFSFFAYLIMNE